MTHSITDDLLSVNQALAVVSKKVKIVLSAEAKEKIVSCRNYLDRKMESADKPIYGINTGFGSLCNTEISQDSLEELQVNLVMSHACGVGKAIDEDLIRLMLLLKVQGLSYGHSGVTLETVERLIWHYNADVLPVIYEFGSLGASGDLAPLAHLALPLIGLGEVSIKGIRTDVKKMLAEAGLQPIALRSKEGLALLNGTQFMSAFGVLLCDKMEQVLNAADLIAAVSLEAFDGRSEAFKANVHTIRRHPGQSAVAKNIRRILGDSKTFAAEKKHVQDPYSFRCIPQVHGASRDAHAYFKMVVENEINAVTDNPTIFPDSDEIISAGNFHGQPLALGLDFIAIATAEIGSISERRIYKLLNGQRGLPDFLVANPGLNSGFMIPQYTAASLVSKNKQLCTPASVDTIDSSNGQEDHVSMGANAATKALEVANNVEQILAIELLNAMQGAEIRGLSGMASSIRDLHAEYRATVPFVTKDCELFPLINSSKNFLKKLNAGDWINRS